MSTDQTRGMSRDGGADVIAPPAPCVPGDFPTCSEPTTNLDFDVAGYRASSDSREARPDRPAPRQPQTPVSGKAVAMAPKTAATAALDARLVRLLRRYAIIAAVTTVAIGSLALLGWITETLWLASLNPAWVTMAVNTAVCLVLSGIGLFLAIPDGRRRPAATVGLKVLAGVVAITGLATFAEYAIGRDFGIDQLLIAQPPVGTGPMLAGRMAPLATVNFVLVGLVLLAHAAKRDGPVSTTLSLRCCCLPAMFWARMNSTRWQAIVCQSLCQRRLGSCC